MLMDLPMIVKFEGENLPLILNALETDNGGQKLVLEVAVCWEPRRVSEIETDMLTATFG